MLFYMFPRYQLGKLKKKKKKKKKKDLTAYSWERCLVFWSCFVWVWYESSVGLFGRHHAPGSSPGSTCTHLKNGRGSWGRFDLAPSAVVPAGEGGVYFQCWWVTGPAWSRCCQPHRSNNPTYAMQRWTKKWGVWEKFFNLSPHGPSIQTPAVILHSFITLVSRVQAAPCGGHNNGPRAA